MDDQSGDDGMLVVAERLCNSCGLSKPIDEFRFKDKGNGLRHSQCNSCFAEYHRGRRQGQRRQEVQRYLERVNDASDPRNYGATTRTEAVVRAMIARFGGLDQFTEFWFRFIQDCQAAGKAHLVQRSLEAMGHFIASTDKNRTAQGSHGELSHEQARELLMEHVVRAIFDDPDLGAAVLEELGYCVEPPDEPTEEQLGPLRRRVEAKITTAECGSPHLDALALNELADCEAGQP